MTVAGVKRFAAMVLLAAALGAPLAVMAQAQSLEVVPIRVSVDGNQARLSFTWTTPVDAETSLVGRTLQIRFSRPLVPRFAEIFNGLQGFVDAAGLTGSGRVVALHLAAPLEIAEARQGSTIELILTRTDGQVITAPGTPVSAFQVPATAPTAVPAPAVAPLPSPVTIQAAAGRADGSPAIRLRFGDHASFSRAVFDWQGPVGYTMAKEGGRLIIRFDRPGQLSPATAAPPLFGSVAQVEGGGNLVVAMAIPDGVRLRDYRAGERVVLDAYAPERATLLALAEQAEAATAEVDAVLDDPVTLLPEADIEPLEADDTVEQPESTAEAAPMIGEPLPSREVPLPAAVPSDEIAADTGPFDPARRWMARQVAPVPQSGMEPDEEVVAELELELESEPEPDHEVAQELTLAAPLDVVETPAFAGEKVLVAYDSLETGIELSFDWQRQAAAAVFTRAGHLWVVFDSPGQLDFRLLDDDMVAVKSAEQVPLAGATAARFRLGGQFRPSVRREGMTWLVTLDGNGGPTTPLEIIIEEDEEVGLRMVLLQQDPGSEYVLFDPEVGDQLIVIPILAAGHGVSPARRTVDLEIIETGQGIAVRPISESIAVHALRNSVEVSSRSGLNLAATGRTDIGDGGGPLTPPSLLAAGDGIGGMPRALEEALPVGDEAPMFDYAAWGPLEDESFRDRKHDLNLELAAAEPSRQIDARLALARFHFASGHAAEAMGWLQHALRDAPWLEDEPGIKALRGASNLLMGRNAEARADLFDPVFDLSREIRLWRGLWLADNGDMVAAYQAFLASGEAPSSYPKRVSQRAALFAGEAAARAGDIGKAHDILDSLRLDRPSGAVLEEVEYVRALTYAAAGETGEALVRLRNAANAENRLVRAKAGRDLVRLELEEDRIEVAEAIDRYDSLRFAWRGDGLELDLMQRMAELYLAGGDYANGLGTYRQAITVFPDSPDVRVIANIMNDTYKNLFIGNTADLLTPLEALAVFYDFRELTPVGAIGDQMIFGLADRLVEVDLLGHAAQVLQHQIDYRLRGNELAKVGARLAEIYLLDADPEGAIRALRASATPGIAVELENRREQLKVRALAETGDYEAALDMLRGNTSLKADRMRTAIYWRQRDWMSAATVSARLLEKWPTPKTSLDSDEADDLMRMAISLAMTNNRPALKSLRREYGALVEQTRRANAFATIASYVDAKPLDPLAIAEAAVEIGAYEDFLGSLREDIEDDDLASAE
jgi:tetratricopeptide (TPR) repeat protein